MFESLIYLPGLDWSWMGGRGDFSHDNPSNIIAFYARFVGKDHTLTCEYMLTKYI